MPIQNSEDEFEEALSIALLQIQECQKQHLFDSCMKCSKVLECEIRKNYVDKVYNSMNKGHTGGFEF